jgi:hypothetical protein
MRINGRNYIPFQLNNHRWVVERRHLKYSQQKRLQRLEITKRIYHRERELEEDIRNSTFGRDGGN